MKTKTLTIALLFCICGAAVAKPDKFDEPQCPIAENGDEWKFVKELSDEFNGKKVDKKKWTRLDRGDSWGVWSWVMDNVTCEDGFLSVTTRYEPHMRGEREFFYTSGNLRSTHKMTYGYIEARLRGCELPNGTCPAFWLYSPHFKKDFVRDTLAYSEIDIVELQQDKDLSKIDCNLHARAKREGIEDPVWVRPQHRPKEQANQWIAPWDPRDDYHVYGCESTPDYIRWYIDGELRFEQPNDYWHIPMNVAFSMGIRQPLLKWVNGEMTIIEEMATGEGFPTSMSVDYVRAWSR